MKIGFVINPYAGIGGSVALKGSDGAAIVEQALAAGAVQQAETRAKTAMEKAFEDNAQLSQLTIYTAAADMGEDMLQSMGVTADVVDNAGVSDSGRSDNGRTSAQDTKNAIRQFVEHKVDLIVFAGGDGTARDVLDVLSTELCSEIPVIGIPAGVKIHSAVYALSPVHAGELLHLLFSGEAMSLHESAVMDLDEQAFREGRVVARCYGYLPVPVDDTRMQLIKQGGLNPNSSQYGDITVQDIAADIIESMQPDVYYLIGSGSTTAGIMEQLGLENTLLGVDIVRNEELVASDVDAQTILATIKDQPATMVVTVIGGQGHVFGRGNQQLSAEVVRQFDRDDIIIIATDEKLRSLEKRPMISDTGDVELDKELAGLYPVVTGYQQKTLYQLR